MYLAFKDRRKASKAEVNKQGKNKRGVRDLIKEAEILKTSITLAFTLRLEAIRRIGTEECHDLTYKRVTLAAMWKIDDFLFFLRRGNYTQGQKQKDLLENYCNNLGEK